MGLERITVRIKQFSDRPALQLQWFCPVTGERKTRSARTNDQEIAEKRRGDLEYELNHGLHREGARVSWERFREAFEVEYMPNVRRATRKIYHNLFDHVERIVQPATMDGITARTVSQLVVGLRQVRGRGPAGRQGMQPSTLQMMTRFFRTALRWANKQGMLLEVPNMPAVKVPKRRPQPVPQWQYDRLHAACENDFMRAFIACGWLAGLRLAEAHRLSREQSDSSPWLDFDRRRIWFPADFAKAVEDQWVPLDPALQALLCALPCDHAPHVFPWHTLSTDAVGDRVIALALRAGVPLTMRSLRRGFGCRYAGRVPAQVLQKLMRHSSIETTLQYYASVDAAVEEAVFGNSSGNNSPESLEKSVLPDSWVE